MTRLGVAKSRHRNHAEGSSRVTAVVASLLTLPLILKSIAAAISTLYETHP